MSENNQNLNEPLSTYEQPLTFEKVWQMFQETNRQFKETDKKFKETDRRIDKLAKLYGGVSDNSKDVAEEFFRRGLESKSSIFGIEYEEVLHLEKQTRKLQGEFDIVLPGDKQTIVFEVKYKLHPNDVKDFVQRKLPGFKLLFPEYCKNKLLGGMAGLSVPRASFDLAQKKGLLVLTQSGENIMVLSPGDSVLKEF